MLHCINEYLYAFMHHTHNLFLYICLPACEHFSVWYMHIYVRVRICKYVCMLAICVCTCICIRMHMCLCLCLYLCLYVSMCESILYSACTKPFQSGVMHDYLTEDGRGWKSAGSLNATLVWEHLHVHVNRIWRAVSREYPWVNWISLPSAFACSLRERHFHSMSF